MSCVVASTMLPDAKYSRTIISLASLNAAICKRMCFGVIAQFRGITSIQKHRGLRARQQTYSQALAQVPTTNIPGGHVRQET